MTSPSLTSYIFSKQQKFGIKTAGLDEKCTAMQMLVVYAKDLKEGFADFAEQVSLFLRFLRFFANSLSGLTFWGEYLGHTRT